MASDPPWALSIENLDNELASVIRVRKRLSESTDVQLPKILCGLLPRLLGRLHRYSAWLESPGLALEQPSGNHLKGRIEILLKDKMQPELLRIFADAFVRVRKNVHMDISYVNIIATFIANSFHNLTPNEEELICFGRGFALSQSLELLHIAVPRCHISSDSTMQQPSIQKILGSVLLTIDKLYNLTMMQNNDAEDAVASNSALISNLHMSSWICLDCFSLLMNTPPLIQQDLESQYGYHQKFSPVVNYKKKLNDFSSNGTKKSRLSQDNINLIAQDGGGIFNLILDMILLSNGCWGQYNIGGLSLTYNQGRLRHRCQKLRHKNILENHTSLEIVKMVCEHLSLWDNLFHQKEDTTSLTAGFQRTIILALISSKMDGRNGRVASTTSSSTAYLDKYLSLVIIACEKHGRENDTDTSSCPFLGMALAIMILVLGYANVKDVLDKYVAHRYLWEDILGKLQTNSNNLILIKSLGRQHLIDNNLSGELLHFVLTGIIEPIFQRDGIDEVIMKNPGLEPLLHLVIVVVKRALGMCPMVQRHLSPSWVHAPSQLFSGLNRRSGIDWIENINQEYLRTLYSFLKCPLSRRNDQDIVLCRRACYKAISSMVMHKTCIQNEIQSPFDLSALLLNLLTNEEDDESVAHITSALQQFINDHTIVRQTLATTLHSSEQQKAQFIDDEGIISSLILASCSDSKLARIIAIEWATKILFQFDSPTATFLCMHHMNDTDSDVSKAATNYLTNDSSNNHLSFTFMCAVISPIVDDENLGTSLVLVRLRDMFCRSILGSRDVTTIYTEVQLKLLSKLLFAAINASLNRALLVVESTDENMNQNPSEHCFNDQPLGALCGSQRDAIGPGMAIHFFAHVVRSSKDKGWMTSHCKEYLESMFTFLSRDEHGGSKGGFEARRIAYKVSYYLTEILKPSISLIVPNHISFSTIILLFELTRKSSLDAKYACEILQLTLCPYKEAADTNSSTISRHGQLHAVTPLLPVLLSSAVSDVDCVRQISACFAIYVVLPLDPFAANFICTYLSSDDDVVTSSTAKKCLLILQSRRCEIQGIGWHTEVDDVTFLFSDYTSSSDRIEMQHDIQSAVDKISNSARIGEAAAYMILRHCKFSLTVALESTSTSKIEDTLELCGVSRTKDPNIKDVVGNCEICLDDTDLENMYAMPCQHYYCTGCWQSFLESKFVDDTAVLNSTCPHLGCHQRITIQEINDITPILLDSWREKYLISRIDLDPAYRRCPGVDCDMIAVAQSRYKCVSSTFCSTCHTSFCFTCAGTPHEPAKCNHVLDWNKTISSTASWIVLNTKPCPLCNVKIEKNDGCNHMRCAHCHAHFCWICLGVFDTREVYTHACNVPSDAPKNNEKRKKFYLERYHAHAQSEAYAKSLLSKTLNTITEMDLWHILSESDKGVIFSSRQIVFESRRFIKNSFIFAYYMNNDRDDKRHTMFESHQVALEQFIEHLSKITEHNDREQWSTMGEELFRKYIKSTALHTLAVKNYIARMSNFIQINNMEDEDL